MRLVVGEISRPQGVLGEIKVKPATDEPDRFLKLKHVFIDGQGFEIEKARVAPQGVFLYLSGIDSRDLAERLRGKTLEIDREHAVPLPEGRYFIVDIIGCEVVTCADTGGGGQKIGVLTDVLQHGGATDIYVVSRADGKRLMFPAVDDVFVEIDPKNKKIVLDGTRLSQIAVISA